MTGIHEATPSQFEMLNAHKQRLARIAGRAFIPEPVYVPPEPEPVVVALEPCPPQPIPAGARLVPWVDASEFYPGVTIGKIKLAVSAAYNCTILDMMSARRQKIVMEPRQVAQYLAKTMTLHSLPMIGRSFGYRDHTTVLHSVNKIERTIKTDPQLAARVAAIRDSITLAGAV